MRRSSFALTALLLLASARPALAAEGGLLSPNPGLIIWTIVVFVLVFAILAKFAFPGILGAVEARERHLTELAEAAERDRAAATALLAENQRLLEETRARVQEAVNEARVSAERLRAESLEQTRREQEALIERARRDIDHEREAAMDSVRREAADVAIAAAERLIRARLDSEGNRQLVNEYLAQLSTPARA